METVNFTLYSHFASALINADESGLESHDIEELRSIEKKIIEETGQCVCVGVSEDSSFSRPEIAFDRNVWSDCSDFDFAYKGD